MLPKRRTAKITLDEHGMDAKTLILSIDNKRGLWIDWKPIAPNTGRRHFCIIPQEKVRALAKWILENTAP